jgi:hypothetical protein
MAFPINKIDKTVDVTIEDFNIDWFVYDSKDISLFKKYGLLSRETKQLAEDYYEVETDIWHRVRDKCDGDGCRRALRKSGFIPKGNLKETYYQDTIVEFGYFYILSPFNGELVRTSKGYVADAYHIAYAFKHEDVEYFILVGRFHGRRCGLVVPERKLVVILDAPEKRNINIATWMLNSVNSIISLNNNVGSSHKNQDPSNTQSSLCLVARTMTNLGHYIWNDLGGVEKYLEQYGVGDIHAVLMAEGNWPTIKEIFPEFMEIPEIVVPRQDLLRTSAELDMMPIRFVGLQISPRLRRRIFDWAIKRDVSGLLDNILAVTSIYRVIWVNVRSHNKIWSSQVLGLQSIINDLQIRYGNIAVLFDGVADATPIASEIEQGLVAGVHCINGLNLEFFESVLWAHHVAAYISVIGSGLVINSWLTDKSGFAHGNLQHISQAKWWNNVADSAGVVTFLDANMLQSSSDLYGNYDFEWKIALDSICAILDAS